MDIKTHEREWRDSLAWGGALVMLYVSRALLPLALVYWIALLAAATVLFLFRNIYVPLLGRNSYRIASVNRESHDTWTLAFEPEGDAPPIAHRPGQFWFLKLIRPGRSTEQHPFTISSSPAAELPITSTIKEAGFITNDSRFEDSIFGQKHNQRKHTMMRQTKTTLAAWGVTGVLAAGLFLFGCNRQAGDAPEGEYMHENTPHHDADDAKDTATSDEDGPRAGGCLCWVC